MKHLYYGYGKGKSTCVIGMAIRAIGAKKKVLFIQFLKNENTSERDVLKSIDNITLTPCPESIKFTYNMTNQEFNDIKEYYINQFNYLTNFDNLKTYDLIIFDEIFSLVDTEILKYERLNDFINSISIDDTREYIFTAHKVDNTIIDKFDYVTHFNKIKHPFDKGCKARFGIEF